MQRNMHRSRLTDILPVNPRAHKSNFKREGNARSRIWVWTCPFKSCQPELNRGKECSGALTKPDAQAYSPSAHMLLAAFSQSSSSYLTLQMEPRTGQTPCSAWSEEHHLLYQLPLMWFGSELSVYAPISLSSCLLLFTSLSLCLADLFPLRPTILPHSSDWQTDRQTGTRTHARTHTHIGNTNVGLFYSPVHPLQVALPEPCINVP